ncbi:MAG: toll/interleukin-1 receptor domain-containing protein, partial [Burkholderiaceae bacterium]
TLRPSADPERVAPRMPEAPARAATDSIFISYRRQDSADVTGRIYDRLIQRFNRQQIFKDVDSIPLGVDFRSHLGNVVGRCDLLLAVIGPQWLAVVGPNGRRLDDPSDFVRIEIEAALARNIPVIPVLVGGAELPAERELPASLAALTYRNGMAVRPDPDFHRDMDRLITGLEAHHRT